MEITDGYYGTSGNVFSVMCGVDGMMTVVVLVVVRVFVLLCGLWWWYGGGGGSRKSNYILYSWT